MKIIVAIIIFSAIVLFHEFGHYIVAKWCGVRVNEFMIGLGPRLFGIQGKETMFSVHLLPFGGACVMEGEDSSSDDPRSFQNKSVFQRFAIVAAGPVFNFILAYVLAMVLVACTGFIPATVDSTMEGYPAEEAGIEAGDEIVDINGYSIHFYQEVRAYIMFHSGDELDITYLRDGEKYETTIVPKYSEESGSYLIGITGNTNVQDASVGEVFSMAFWETRYLIYVTIQSLKMMFTGQVGLQDMSGPVGIVKTIGDAYEESLAVSVYYAVMEMISLTILLSANLGVMNLLPFPALDGGRLVFFIVEMIRRKKAPEKVENFVNILGFALLMGLMVLIMFNDVFKLFNGG